MSGLRALSEIVAPLQEDLKAHFAEIYDSKDVRRRPSRSSSS